MGHAQHRISAGLEFLDFSNNSDESKNIGMKFIDSSVVEDFSKDKIKQKIAHSVSEYASTDPAEFVAEVYAKLVGGGKVSDDVMNLYKFYKGPAIG